MDTNVNQALLNRDYTLIIDRSGSMSAPCAPHASRWKAAEESTIAVARKISEFDPDGITVYSFSSHHKRFDNVTPDKVKDVFRDEPNGSTNLAGVLNHAFENYFSRKKAGKAQPNGESFFVVTDGCPDDESEVARAIVSATKKLDKAQEMSVTFIQVGDDHAAAKYLKRLDDDLEGEGAKYDIVDAISVEDMGSKSLTDVITEAVTEHKQHVGAA